MNEKQFKELKRRYDLVNTDTYKAIRELALEKIISLSASGVDEKELKGMVRLINYTDSFESDYLKEMEK